MLRCEELRARAPQPPWCAIKARATHNARARAPRFNSQGAGLCNAGSAARSLAGRARGRAARTRGWFCGRPPPHALRRAAVTPTAICLDAPELMQPENQPRLLFKANLLRFHATRLLGQRLDGAQDRRPLNGG